MPEFRAWPKTPRLFRDMVITEKIDGTNAAVIVDEDGSVAAQSRSRLITPEADNFGFAKWVYENSDKLANLGPGYHYGEWWGSGIQRGYGFTKGERFFSLFNVHRWDKDKLDAVVGLPNLTVVPTLKRYTFSEYEIETTLDDLANNGSQAAPGYRKPEGICVFHTQSKQIYKVLLENDDKPKSIAGGW